MQHNWRHQHNLIPQEDINIWRDAVTLFWSLNDNLDENLTDNYLQNIPTTFAEHHILIPTQKEKSPIKMAKDFNQLRKLAVTMADSSLEITTLDPAAKLIRCSISMIHHEKKLDTQQYDRSYQQKIESAGFRYMKDEFFNEYLKKYISFLDMPLFFSDYPLLDPDSGESIKFKLYDLVARLGDFPSISLKNRTPKHEVKDYRQDKYFQKSNDLIKGWDFWVDLLKEEFIKKFKDSNQPIEAIWTMAVGAPILKKWENMPPDDPGLAGKIALFLTVQIDEKKKNNDVMFMLFHEVINRIKVRLVQHLSARAYDEVVRQREEIKKREKENRHYQWRFKSLQNPLKNIADSMRTMYQQVNSMETALYDPRTNLFKHHQDIDKFFNPEYSFEWGDINIEIKHAPVNYNSPEEAALVLGAAILSLLGKDVIGGHREWGDQPFDSIKNFLNEINNEVNSPQKDSFECLKQLLKNENNCPDNWWIEDRIKLIEYARALDVLKSAFHTSFKPATEVWPLASLFVALWPHKGSDRPSIKFSNIDDNNDEFKEITDFGNSDFNLELPSDHSPITFTNLLTFVMAVCNEYNNRKDVNSCVTKCKVDYLLIGNNSFGLKVYLHFDSAYHNPSDQAISDFRSSVRNFALNREKTCIFSDVPWIPDSVGDMIRPWRDLMRCIENFKPEWKQDVVLRRDVMRYKFQQREFAASINDGGKTIALLWLPVD